MRRSPVTRRPDANSEDQLFELFDKLDALTGEGLQHGFFDLNISISVGKEGMREVLINAGKKYRYIVRDLDLARRVKRALIPRIGTESPVRDPEERRYQ